MNSKYYGQISLTRLGEIVRQHPELVKEVPFKDGHKEKFINVSILAEEQPNQYGKIGAVRVDCKERKDTLNYYVGDLRQSLSNLGQQPQQQPQQQPKPQQQQRPEWDTPAPAFGDNNDGLPF